MALKPAALKLIRNNKDFEDQAKIFANPNSAKADIIKAGERALVCLYKGKSDDNLDSLCLQRYHRRSAEEQHLWNQRFFHQPQEQPFIIVWESTCSGWETQSQLQLTEWGWYGKGGRYFTVLTDKAAAPPNLLKIIRCNCKTGCSSRQCTCRTNGLEYTNACGVCRGVCTNLNAVQFMERLKEAHTSKSNIWTEQVEQEGLCLVN